MSARQRIGVLGGTFDPVHSAHIALAQLFARRLALDEVRLMVAGAPWQKQSIGANPEMRLEMLRIGFADVPFPVVIDTRELERTGDTYSVDTLRELRGDLGAHAMLVLLIGADQLQRLDTWSRWHEIFQLANLAVAARDGSSWEGSGLKPRIAAEILHRQVAAAALPDALAAPCGQVALLDATLGPTSSSEVRAYLQSGDYDALRDLVPSGVVDYIRAHNLYRD